MIPLLLHNRIYGQFWFAASFLLLSIAIVEGLKCRGNDDKTQQDFNDVVRACMSSIHSGNGRNDNNNSSSIITGRNENNRYNEDQRNTGHNMRKNYNRGNTQQYNNNNHNNRNTYNRGLDESEDSSEDSGYQHQRNRGNGGGIYDRNIGFRNPFDQGGGGRRSNRTSSSNSSRRPALSSPLEDIEPCIVHCVFRQMRMLDGDSKPDKSSVISVMTQKINNPELKEFIQDSIMDCFEIVESDFKVPKSPKDFHATKNVFNCVIDKSFPALNVDEKCEFSKQFALCLEEKGQQNCEDWDDNSSRKNGNNNNHNRNGNNRQDISNNKNNMRQNNNNNNNGNNGNGNSNPFRG